MTALGTQASEIALLVQAKQLTGSPLAVGLLGVVELVPLVAAELHARWATGLMFAAPSVGAFGVTVFSGWMDRRPASSGRASSRAW